MLPWKLYSALHAVANIQQQLSTFRFCGATVFPTGKEELSDDCPGASGKRQVQIRTQSEKCMSLDRQIRSIQTVQIQNWKHNPSIEFLAAQITTAVCLSEGVLEWKPFERPNWLLYQCSHRYWQRKSTIWNVLCVFLRKARFLQDLMAKPLTLGYFRKKTVRRRRWIAPYRTHTYIAKTQKGLSWMDFEVTLFFVHMWICLHSCKTIRLHNFHCKKLTSVNHP